MPKSPYPLATLKETSIPLDIIRPLRSRILSFTDVAMGTPISITDRGLFLLIPHTSAVAVNFTATPITLAQATGAAFSADTLLLLPAANMSSLVPYTIQAPGPYLSAVAVNAGEVGKLWVIELAIWDALATETQLSFG
jgi:hypothetical protein